MADVNYVDEKTCNDRTKSILCKVDLQIEKLETRMAGMDDALQLRTAELDRRLEGLNQLREEVVQDRSMYLRQDVYNLKTAQYDSWVTEVNKRLTIIETRSIVWTGALALFFVLVQIVLHYLQIIK